jgi:hypothetical protein
MTCEAMHGEAARAAEGSEVIEIDMFMFLFSLLALLIEIRSSSSL